MCNGAEFTNVREKVRTYVEKGKIWMSPRLNSGLKVGEIVTISIFQWCYLQVFQSEGAKKWCHSDPMN